MNAESVIKTLKMYGGSSLVPVLFAVAVIYIYWTGNRQIRKRLLLVIGLSFLVFNDLFFFLCKKAGMGMEYYRFFWMIPVVPILACTFIELLGKKNAVRIKVVWVVVAVLILASSGDTYLKLEEWKLPENKYGVSQDVLQVSTIIENLKEKERPIVAFDYRMNMEIRQYDAAIICALSRDEYLTLSGTGYVAETEEYEDAAALMRMINNGEQGNGDGIRRILEKRSVDFIVVRNDVGVENYLNSIRYKEVGRSNNYIVYIKEKGK